ncbi:MAG: PBP1A family penicillin-binding protein [Patescibacteria group bacterium]
MKYIGNLNKRNYGYAYNNKQPKKKFNIGNKDLFSKKNLVLFFLTVAVFVFIISTISIIWISKDLPDPDKLTDRQVNQSTKIFDRTGEHLLYEIFLDERRTIVELEEIPQNLIHGVIATEDTAFYEHKGIRPLSILRAFVYGLLPGKRVSGTSTLTQQLVKNAILSNERSYTRKIKEAILSIRLEQKYSKDQILKIYFNEIPYGSTNYGVESASQSYFGKHVSNLTLAECATLAGLPQSPSTYLNNLDKLKNRRDFVLRRMFEEGYISEEEKNQAQNEILEIKQSYHNIEAPHFVLYVKEQLVNEFGETVVAKEGLKVITTLDWEKQQAAEKIINEDSTPLLEKASADNVSLVSIDPKNGQILAMIGSKDFFNDEIDGQFNVATLGRRQPGSSFKPIIYAAAFEKGYTPETILYDVLTDFDLTAEEYIPHNYDLKEYGPVSIRKALQGSLNIPAVKTLYLVGLDYAIKFAEKMGYTSLSQGDFGLSLVLGGGEVSLLEHTNAYSAFANNGINYKPVSILQVEDKDGKILSKWKKEKGNQAIEPDIANLISSVLSDDSARSYIFGSNGSLTLKDRPVAAKTGTTNSYVDGWTVGYTPSLVTGVWVGNTNNSPMNKNYGGGTVAAPIWNKFMTEALKNTPIENFKEAPENKSEKPILKGQNDGTIKLKIDVATGKLATSSTPEKYIEEKIFMTAHSILHYVNKDDPNGPVPEHPEDDPQYFAWEKGIQDWINRKKQENPDWNVSFEEPPSEYDDLHSLELIPQIEIISPAQGIVLDSDLLSVDIKTSAKRGVAKVTYKIDDETIKILSEYPFNLNYSLNNLEVGNHILTIIAEDDIGNFSKEFLDFNFKPEKNTTN